ncbi:MAG: hypothetical protein CMG14_03045 [Candidatus Marinimicrobia bacterium]|nr:hypothetical protein [Candidatus Neomarinimicrobiota bacterium]|tara:strand:+ start:2071 stop:2472 length:402 start_codon:yes stop_codon:yes gene_type:complete
MDFKKKIILFISSIFLSACSMQMEVNITKDDKNEERGAGIIVENTKLKTYKGWWVYGEGQHIFKDEETLDEYNLEFPYEDMKELSALYLAVCEMEYFPMECAMKGYIQKNISAKQNTLLVLDFEILYIEGCGE